MPITHPNIIIITPLLLGQTIHPEVINGISRNGDYPWLISTQPKQLDIYCTEAEINLNRHKLQMQVFNLKQKPEFIVLMDSDVVVGEGCINTMVEYLKSNSDVVCVTIDTKRGVNNGHILTALACIRYEDFNRLRYLNNEIYECACKKIAKLGKVIQIDGVAYEVER